MNSALGTALRQELVQNMLAEQADYAINHTISLALRPALNAAKVIESCTLFPWVISMAYRSASSGQVEAIHIVQRAMSDPPLGIEELPADAELMRLDVFCALGFHSMTPAVRERYRPQYRAFLLWRKARAAGKNPYELMPWVDYDPSDLDQTADRFVSRGTGE